MTRFTVTILDLPEIMEIVEEALSAVPPWEQERLRERLNAIIARAKAAAPPEENR